MMHALELWKEVSQKVEVKEQIHMEENVNNWWMSYLLAAVTKLSKKKCSQNTQK